MVVKRLNEYVSDPYIAVAELFIERDMAQWLERGALPMSLPAVRFRILLGSGLSCFSPLNIGTLF